MPWNVLDCLSIKLSNPFLTQWPRKPFQKEPGSGRRKQLIVLEEQKDGSPRFYITGRTTPSTPIPEPWLQTLHQGKALRIQPCNSLRDRGFCHRLWHFRNACVDKLWGRKRNWPLTRLPALGDVLFIPHSHPRALCSARSFLSLFLAPWLRAQQWWPEPVWQSDPVAMISMHTSP